MATAAQLDEARTAYHQLMTGTKARVVVDQNGERVEFTATTAGKLAQYIESLEIALGEKSRSANFPMKVFF